jgi:ligand-binding sensor domain-containing protein
VGRGWYFMFVRRVIFKRSSSEFLVAWVTLVSWAIACAAYPLPAFSEPIPHWFVFTQESSDLPSDFVFALAPGADGALWIGTNGGGLARLDKDGRWQSYSKANTNGGLPNDTVRALAPGADGALWIGTVGGGLARLDKDGRWQSYSTANTKGGLPDDGVSRHRQRGRIPDGTNRPLSRHSDSDAPAAAWRDWRC